MAYLIRTFTQDTPLIGSVITAPKDTDVYDVDTGIVFPQEGKPVFNKGPYSAHAAVGYADPLFSLFPVSSDFINIRSGESPYGTDADKAAKRMIEQFGDYYEGLPQLLKRGSLKDSIKYADGFLNNISDEYVFDEGEWGNFAMAELPEDFPLKEKGKYTRLLKNLRGYGPYSYDMDEMLKDPDYDRPQHALIEAEIKDIQKAKDKISKYSAENDGPNEYRVSKYVTKGLWTPRHVDTVIKKYFPDYIPGKVRSLNDNDNDRAKDALQEIIQHDADDILSDKDCKDIVNEMDSQLNSTFVGNIASAVNRKY